MGLDEESLSGDNNGNEFVFVIIIIGVVCVCLSCTIFLCIAKTKGRGIYNIPNYVQSKSISAVANNSEMNNISMVNVENAKLPPPATIDVEHISNTAGAPDEWSKSEEVDNIGTDGTDGANDVHVNEVHDVIVQKKTPRPPPRRQVEGIKENKPDNEDQTVDDDDGDDQILADINTIVQTSGK